jgi:hypothetical protein
MKRRQFLSSASALGAVALVPAAAHAAIGASAKPAPRFTLLRADADAAGARFADPACADAICTASRVRVRIDGLHAADGGPVLQELWLNALFEKDGGGTAPFVAWQFSQGPRPHMGQRLSFVATRDRLRGFALDYRTAQHAACVHESCALTSFSLPLLAPGQYVLLGPRRNGRAAPTRGLRASGDAAAPLQWEGARDFDYVSFRIEALA